MFGYRNLLKLTNFCGYLKHLKPNVSSLPHVAISEEILHSLESKLPVVALESTIITHGMPFPRNIECALEVERQVRLKDAIPATIAILDGRIKVGLTNDELLRLGDTKNNKSVKTSRRDMPYVIANKLSGGTTVSGTLVVAGKVGISVFATGGLGGVHRLGEKTFDISADLIELGKTPVAVVSSGIKSILDIPKTLEYLETQGVFVATYGTTKEFPAFYCRKSGVIVPYNITSAKEAAGIIKTNRDINLKSGILFGVPVPTEYALDDEQMNAVIGKALELAHQCGIIGKEITPFLLERVADATGGKSLQTNIELVKNNAGVAADIAVELSWLEACGSSPANKPERNERRPVVIGGSVLDRCVTLSETDIKVSENQVSNNTLY